jgi:glycosyltransferase involved in cell wall biosynthesis
MIVKNEEKYLEDCLRSVESVVDEIVIVDTGSSDRTLDIAQKYKAKIFHFDWVNDFSAARNFALEKSTGDWILYLDADERLREKDKKKIKTLLLGSNKRSAFSLVVNSINEVNNRAEKMNYVRLFPNNPKIKFEGAAHEQIVPSLLKNNYKIVITGIEIIHLGYNISKEELQRKAERNLSILLEDYKNKKSSYVAFH